MNFDATVAHEIAFLNILGQTETAQNTMQKIYDDILKHANEGRFKCTVYLLDDELFFYDAKNSILTLLKLKGYKCSFHINSLKISWKRQSFE